MTFRLVILVFALLFLNENLKAQEAAGLVHSNYAGTNVLWFNPAGMHHQKDWLSVNIFTGDLFFSNDYGYMTKESFSIPKLLTGNLNITMHQTYSINEQPFYIYDNNHNTRHDADLKFQGPSIMFVMNQHAFALFSGGRSILHTRNITPELGNFIYYGFDYIPQHNEVYQLEDYNSSTLSWGEIGISYAYQWNRKLFSNWNFGVSLKMLYGVGGSYLHVDNVNYNISNDTTLELVDLNATLAYSIPMDYATNEFPVDPFINGKGWSFDVGIEYQRLLNRQAKYEPTTACSQKHYNYKFRVGLSLMDFGLVTFNSNAQLHNYSNISYVWEEIDTLEYQNWEHLTNEISTRFYGDPNASLQETSFKMWLPSSLNGSFDYNFENNIYINSSFVLNLPINGNYMRKPSVFSITPRYETRNFEASIPLSLYRGKYPRVGLALRLYYFTVGSDYFTSLLGIQDFNGMDFYFSIKVNIEKGSCTRRNTINPCGDAFKKFPWSK